MIDAARAEKRTVTAMFYPEEREPLFDLGAGVNARTAIGDPGYQVSDGEIVTL